MLTRVSTLAFPLAVAAISIVILMPSDRPSDPVVGTATPKLSEVQPGAVAAAALPGPAATPSDSAPLNATLEVAPSLPASSDPAPAGERTAVAALPQADVPPAEIEEPAVATPRTPRVVSGAVNLRAGPSTSTAKLLVLQPGEKVMVTEASGGWSQVETESGEIGWVSSRYLATPGAVRSAAVNPMEEQEERRLKPRTLRVNVAVALRAGPSRSAPRLFVLQPSEKVSIAEVRGRWIRVVVASGASGWLETRRVLQ